MNVSFTQMRFVGNLSELTLFGIITIKALSTIDKEGELYVSYGIECTFYNIGQTNGKKEPLFKIN